MYKAFYSLSQDPFTKDIRPQDHFPSKGFKEALARIRYLVETRGMCVILGEPGCGKTYALRSVAESLHPSLYRTVLTPEWSTRRSHTKVKYIGRDLPGSLVSGKIYEVLAIENGFYRIIDESREDYLYDKMSFVTVEE